MVRYHNMGIAWEEELRFFFSGLLNTVFVKRMSLFPLNSENLMLMIGIFTFLKVYVEYD